MESNKRSLQARSSDTSHDIGMKSLPFCFPTKYFGKLTRSHFLIVRSDELWLQAGMTDSDIQTGEYLEVTRASQLRKKSNWKIPGCSMHFFLGHSWKQTFIVKIPSHLQVFLLLALQWQGYKTKHVYSCRCWWGKFWRGT